MAVVLGTNSGFVTVAPTADPTGSNSQITERVRGSTHSFAGNFDTVTEMGVYISTATATTTIEIGIYADDGGTPGALIDSATMAKGGTAGWKIKTGFSIPVAPGTTYYISVVCTDESTSYCDWQNSSGTYFSSVGIGSFADPFQNDAGPTTGSMAVYALLTKAPEASLTGTKGTKAIATRYPVEKGLTAETTSQTGRIMNLIPQEKSLVSTRKEIGLRGR